jgi:hypothetical protein
MSSDTPIIVDCEGSGCPAHRCYDGFGICSMCGQTVLTNNGTARPHTRSDVIAMLKRGPFDE